MKMTRLNMIAWRLGRIVGFLWYPMALGIVTYAAWVAAEVVGRG